MTDRSKEDEVGLNKRVTVYFEEDDETEEYKIVTAVRGNSLKGLITRGFLPWERLLWGTRPGTGSM